MAGEPGTPVRWSAEPVGPPTGSRCPQRAARSSHGGARGRPVVRSRSWQPTEVDDSYPTEQELSVDFDQQVSITDHRYGPIMVTVTAQRSVVLEGDNVPLVRIGRTEGARTHATVPVGTRRPEDLTMTLDGQPARLSPARGRLSRRSYRIDVTHEGAHYRLQPISLAGSRLRRDGRPLGELFWLDDDRFAEWEPSADLRPSDAALGYALAASFGTGAQPFWMTALDLVAAATPG